MQLTFLGATGTVTGSKYLLESGSGRVLVDCGLFQGLKQLRLRNWAPFPVDPASLDAVLLTHAHLDHSGYLPLLVRNGFRGPVYCTAGTLELCRILLPDSGHLQEEEAAYANRHGFSKHDPALPLYTREDAVACLEHFHTVQAERDLEVGAGLTARFHAAGHILGAAMVSVRGEGASILFSGDLGRPGDPLLPDPARIEHADYLVLESTYGDRLHSPIDPLDQLAEVITRTAARGGAVIIPAFAVGRTQMLLYLIQQLKSQGRIPGLPIYLDSPMAQAATRVFRERPEGQRLSPAERTAVANVAVATETVGESMEIDRMRYPRVIISASGMATGGRVLHHLKALAPDDRNTIALVGYQAAGSRGAALLGGAKAIKIHGEYVPVRAEVVMLENLSAHADYAETIEWLKGFRTPPVRTYITHGEPVAADALRLHIEEALGWADTVPEYRETDELQGGVSGSARPRVSAAAHPGAAGR
jgi:metallo-beta-lactamase family protein